MALKRVKNAIKLTITTDEGTQTFSKINIDATVDEAYNFLSNIAQLKKSEASRFGRAFYFQFVNEA